MRLVKLSDLSEEERKKALEEQQERLNKNRQEAQNIQKQANNDFNNYIQKHGAYDTNQHTTSIGDIKKAYKNTSSYDTVKNSLNNYYNNNNTSIWDRVKSTFNNLMYNQRQNTNVTNNIDEQAKQENNNAKFILKTQETNKTYKQKQEDTLKNSLTYKQAKLRNPNATDEELLKIAQNDNNEVTNNLIKDIASKNGVERTTELRNISTSQSNPLFYDNNKFREINNNVLQYKTTKEAQEEADKINEDLENEKIGSSVGHILEAMPEKAMEAIASPIYATGSLLNLKLPNGTADQDLKDFKTISSKYDQTTANIKNGIVKDLSNVSGTLGYMIPSIIASAMAPETNLGKIVQGVSVGGQGYMDNLNDDASNKLKSALTGVGKGYASYVAEGITGGNILGKGSLDDLAVKTITAKTKNKVGQKIASMIYEVGGETFEETLENQLDYLTDKVVNDKGISLKDWLEEQKETVKGTILSTLTLKCLGLGGNTYKEVQQYSQNKETNKWINEAQKIIDKENLVIDTEKLKAKNNQKEVNNVLSTLDNISNNNTQNQIKQQKQQITPTQSENASNLNMAENDISNPTIKDFNESAKQYNIDYSNEDLKEINQMFNNRGIKAYFDENTFKNNNDAFSVWKPVIDEQGNISRREVVFNPNAKDSKVRVQELAIHELGHDLDLNEVQDMILKDASRKENWEGARKSLENTYREAYKNDGINISEEDFNKIVDEEATMSILQRELGNQEYVNRLVNQNQSVAKKIYNWVIDKLNKFTGGKNERIFWEDIKNKFETAYNQEFNKNDSNIYKKYSIQTDNNGNKYVKVDTDQNIFDGIDNKDYNKVAKMYIQDYLMGKTRLSDNDTAVIDRKSANKYTNPGKKQQNFDKKMQLTPELKNVLEIAQKDSVSLPIKNNSKYKSWEYYKFDFELSGKKFNGTVNIGIDSNGNKHFYEINKIKEVDDISGTSLNRSSTSLSNNSLPSTQQNVNSQPLQKYSMQESENNSDFYSLPTKEWQQFVEDNYQKQGKGKNLKEYNLPTKENVNKKVNLSTKENINKQYNQITQGEKIDWNEIERPEGKIRKHYRSIIESSNTTNEAKAIAKELMGTDTYVPETNNGQLAQADYRISNSSPEAELKSLMNRTIQGEKISSVDIAVGERLIQYYSKIGDKDNLQNAIQATAMAGTSAGQTVQALAMLNHQTPEGQATWIQRSVDKMNNELAKRKGGTITKDEEGNVKVVNKNGKDITDKVDLFNLTSDMIDKIVSSKNKTEMYDNIDQVYEDLGQQVPLSTMEKIDSWRYFSMLANPKTHIRNIVGNVAMGKTQSLKDKLAGGIEDIVSTFNKDMERTKTLKRADAKTKEFAKNDVLNPDVQSMMELNENKYNPQSRLQNARKTFKNDALENTLGRLFNWNDKLLEAEDALGLKSNYKKALANYLTANKIDVDNITDKQLSKARNYAVEQAKEATFHQANSIATAINQFSKKNGLTKGFTDAVLPFVKTPLNVAKAGLEYNPTGLLKTITYDTVKLRKGEITVNKYIDNLSKGLTGTGIAVLGYALADAGILKASGGDDDKKEKYDETLGKQTYSITIGERTYSLDWLSPVGIPLFVGAEAKAIRDSKKEEKSSISSDDDKKVNQAVSSLENLANAMANSMSPMSEMSMISGLISALKSYEQDSTKMLGTIGTNAVKSYINQFVPTALGQIARTTDDYERSTTSTKSNGLSKDIDQTKLQVMSKIPGLRQKLPIKTDIWGNEQKSEPNLPVRIVNNFINPATVKSIDTSKVDEELDNLYNKIGEPTILPSTIDKKYTINGQTYRMTNEEYSKYKKNYGQTSYKLLDDLINSSDYNKLSDDQKQKAIENIYSYAKEVNKVDYAKNNNETLKTSTLYDTLEELKQKGGNQSSYLNYIAKTKDITGEGANKKKIGILANSNYSDKTKEIIYKNVEEGSKDKKIILVDKLGLPINEYLKYKSQIFENDKDEDGETISGSRKEKVYDYLNNIPDEDLPEDYKKIILKIEDINDYDNDIVNFVNNSEQLNYDERTEILKDIGFKIDKDGKILTISRIPIVKYVK